MSDALRAPGTPWQRGAGPRGVGSQPRASMVQGMSPQLAQAAATAGLEATNAARELGEEVEAMAKRMFEEDRVTELQERKATFQEKMEAIVRDQDSGILTLKGGNAKGATKSFDEQAQAVMEDSLAGLSGRTLNTAKNTLHAVRMNYMQVVAQHELSQREAMQLAARTHQEKSMLSTVAARASTENEAKLTDTINAEIMLTMQNFKGGPEQRKAEVQRLTQEAWGVALRSRISARPMEALELMARIKSGQDTFWKAENLGADLLVAMHGEARDAYVSTAGQRYKDQVEQYGLEVATKAIQGDKWLSEAEKGGLIREAKQIKRALISDVQNARTLHVQALRDTVVSNWVQGKQYTDKDLFDLGFRGKDLENAKDAQKSFFKKEPVQTDTGTLLALVNLAENGWTNPDTGKHSALKQEDLARPEFSKALANVTKEDLFGKVLPAIKKSEERGAGVQKVRADAKSVFNSRAKSIYGKNSDQLWQAEEQWNINYDALTKKLGREPSAEELSQMGNEMMSNVITGSNFWGKTSSRRWEARYAIRTEGKALVPEEAREAIVKQYVDKGLEAPDEETIFQRYTDPRNADWLEEALKKEKGVAHAAELPSGGGHTSGYRGGWGQIPPQK